MVLDLPVDHRRPAGPTFEQHLSLLHRGTSRPLVLVSTGYDDFYRDHPSEPTVLLGANQVVIEHRFFGASVPESGDLRFLDIEQAAGDHHAVVEAMRRFYSGPFVSTGASKGGMASVYHRRFYPDDVVATVAYVAPLSLGAPDERYIDFVDGIGPVTCRAALRDLQLESLDRRGALEDRLHDLARREGWSLALAGGVSVVFESHLVMLPFGFWQYGSELDCLAIPPRTATDLEIFRFLEDMGLFRSADDEYMRALRPYRYQAATQLGYPALATTHLEGRLLGGGPTLEDTFPGVPIVHDAEAMRDIAAWVTSEGSELLFVYGDHDPWTAGAFAIDEARDQYSFTAPRQNHWAAIDTLQSADQRAALDALARWVGVPVMPPARVTAPARALEVRRAFMRRGRMLAASWWQH